MLEIVGVRQRVSVCSAQQIPVLVVQQFAPFRDQITKWRGQELEKMPLSLAGDVGMTVQDVLNPGGARSRDTAYEEQLPLGEIMECRVPVQPTGQERFLCDFVAVSGDRFVVFW